jgi:O-antigen/teichoic acid export membrane protein
MPPHTDLTRPASEANSSIPNLPRRSRARFAVNDASLPLTATVIPHNPNQEGHRQLLSKYTMESPVTRDRLSIIQQRMPRRVVLIPMEPVIRDSLSTTRQRFYSRILASRYFRHNILLIGTNILAGIFAYLLHPFLGRMMSIQEYGQVAALISLSLVLTTPTQIIATVAAKYASSLSSSEAHARLNDFIRRLTAILLAAGVGITAVFVASSSYVAFFFHLNSPQAVILLGLIFIVLFITPLNQGTLQGLHHFGWFATITLLSSFLRLVLAIGFVLIGLGVNGAILGIVVSTLLACLISFKPLWKVLRGPRTPTGSLQSLWTYSILALAVTAGLFALSSLDTILAEHFLSASDAGLYAALATIGRTVLLITTGITTVMFPRVVALHERGEPHTRVVIQSMLGVLVLSVAVETVFYFAPSLMTKLMFGQAFVAIAGQLAPYGMAMLLLAVSWVIINYFLAIGNRPFVLIVILACALETGLIVWHHAAIAQVVQAVIVTNAALLLALLIAFGLRAWRTPAGSRFRRKRGRFNWRGRFEPSSRPSRF